MDKKYIPNYSKGEIIVSFKKKDISRSFAEDFGDMIGYECVNEEPFSDFYLFRVDEGKEDKAIKEFEKYKKIVDGAERRDLKLEKRFEFSENLESIVRTLPDHAEEEDFKKYLEDIKKYIDSFDD